MKLHHLASALAALCAGSACANSARYSVQVLWPSGYQSCGMFGIAGDAKVGWGVPSGGTAAHALLWPSLKGTQMIDLNPPGMTSVGAGTRGGVQVGQAALLGSVYHAYLWRGSMASAVDLNPVTCLESGASDVYGLRQGGWGRDAFGTQHAFLWAGSSLTARDINPPDWSSSQIIRMWTRTQVGSGVSLIDGWVHPILWRGTAASAIDLLPNGFANAEACATNDSCQVGEGWGVDTYAPTHALLWRGSADTCVDLHPEGYYSSQALGVNDSSQVGYAQESLTSPAHAMLWYGSAASAVDLHKYLSSSYLSSDAQEIDQTTGVICGEATDSMGRSWAVLWTPILPEGSSTVGDP